MKGIIAVDLDGTLLNTKKDISDANAQAVKSAVESGMKFVIATGRTFEAAKQYYNRLGLNTPVIACNGGYVYDPQNKEVIYGKHMEKTDLLRVFELVEEQGLYCQYYTADCIYTKELDFLTKEWAERNEKLKEEDRANIRIVEDPVGFAKNTKENIYKILVMDRDAEKIKGLRAKLEGFENLEIVTSVSKGIDIMSKGVTKGAGIRILSGLYDCPMENIMAIGDNDNDLSMIEAAGTGVAMGNASEHIKKAADFTTLENDMDGVKFAIEKFIG